MTEQEAYQEHIRYTLLVWFSFCANYGIDCGNSNVLLCKIFRRWAWNGCYGKFCSFICANHRDSGNFDFWNFPHNKHHWI